MKIQDIIFLILFVVLLYKRDPRWFVGLGMISLIVSVPLFSFWIFFTAERLTWYAGAFLLVSIILQLRKTA